MPRNFVVVVRRIWLLWIKSGRYFWERDLFNHSISSFRFFKIMCYDESKCSNTFAVECVIFKLSNKEQGGLKKR